MGDKEEKTLTRLELADYLQNLSEQLRRGAIEAHGRQWTVPDNLDVRMELKEKSYLVAKLSWSWSTLGDYDRPSRDEVSRYQDSMKTVKKRMGASFKALQQAVGQQGAFPDDRTLEDFVASSQAFAALAEPDWQGAMQEYLDHLANLQHAVANRQQEVMLHELRDLQACMSSCHREFKSRSATAK